MIVSYADFVVDCVNDRFRLMFSSPTMDVYVVPNCKTCNRILHIKRTGKLYYYHTQENTSDVNLTTEYNTQSSQRLTSWIFFAFYPSVTMLM